MVPGPYASPITGYKFADLRSDGDIAGIEAVSITVGFKEEFFGVPTASMGVRLLLVLLMILMGAALAIRHS